MDQFPHMIRTTDSARALNRPPDASSSQLLLIFRRKYNAVFAFQADADKWSADIGKRLSVRQCGWGTGMTAGRGSLFAELKLFGSIAAEAI